MDADTSGFDDPELSLQRLPTERLGQCGDDVIKMGARGLARQPKDGDARVAVGRINQRIGEIHVQRHQRTLLRRTAAQQLCIGGPFQLLHGDRANIMAGSAERLPTALA